MGILLIILLLVIIIELYFILKKLKIIAQKNSYIQEAFFDDKIDVSLTSLAGKLQHLESIDQGLYKIKENLEAKNNHK